MARNMIPLEPTAALVTDGEAGVRTITHVWGPIPDKDGRWTGKEGWIDIKKELPGHKGVLN